MHADTTIDNQEEYNLKMTAIVLSVSDAELKGDFFFFLVSVARRNVDTKVPQICLASGICLYKSPTFFSPNTASV